MRRTNLHGVTLRLRMVIASIVAAVGLVIMGVVLYGQYQISAAVASAVHDALAPAADDTASIMLEQANASGSLSDYIMLERETSLTEYRASIAKSAALLQRVESTLPADESDLKAKVKKARETQQAWVATDAEPVITLMAAGKRNRAMKVTNSPEAWSTYREMTSASSSLNQAVNDIRDQAAAALSTVNRWLGASLIVVGIAIMIGLLAFIFGLQRWVLAPLRRLQADLQAATTLPGHESPIAQVGPPELRAVSGDAEGLRRELVSEIDQARAAREGLAQDAPLVAAMESELAAPASPQLDGLVLHGVSQSAEGVMAGDWWDAVPTPDHCLAIVVADVSGHGPEASVTALRVRSILRSTLQAGAAPHVALGMAATACADDPHFVTGIILVIDPRHSAIRWANAGHHPAIVVTRHGQTSLCDATGPLVSALGGEWTTRQIAFDPASVVLAFTDGLVESRNAEGDELESTAVAQFIRDLDVRVRNDPQELIARLLAQVRHRAADWRRDDVTLVAVAHRE